MCASIDTFRRSWFFGVVVTRPRPSCVVELDSDQARLEVDVGPTERHELAAAHSGAG
jgi:hypothetical protein